MFLTAQMPSKWTKEELSRFKELIANGNSIEDTSKELNKPIKEVNKRYNRLNEKHWTVGEIRILEDAFRMTGHGPFPIQIQAQLPNKTLRQCLNKWEQIIERGYVNDTVKSKTKHTYTAGEERALLELGYRVYSQQCTFTTYEALRRKYYDLVNKKKGKRRSSKKIKNI